MKMKFIALVVILFPLLVQAQAFQIDKPPLPIDSLKKVLPSLRDSARVDCLNELARSYTEEETPRLFDSAWSLVRQAYAEASLINYIKGLGVVVINRQQYYLLLNGLEYLHQINLWRI